MDDAYRVWGQDFTTPTHGTGVGTGLHHTYTWYWCGDRTSPHLHGTGVGKGLHHTYMVLVWGKDFTTPTHGTGVGTGLHHTYTWYWCGERTSPHLHMVLVWGQDFTTPTHGTGGVGTGVSGGDDADGGVSETPSMQGRRANAVTDMEASSVVARVARPKSGVPDVRWATHPDADRVDK